MKIRLNINKIATTINRFPLILNLNMSNRYMDKDKTKKKKPNNNSSSPTRK